MAPPTQTSHMLVTGEYFDYLSPDPSVINLDVLEHGLQAPRFSNQTMRPISIAEHSLRVARIADELTPVGKTFSGCPARLWGLLHDAHEAVLPWGDCLRPGKTRAMKEDEACADIVIAQALGIGDVTEPVRKIVKTADSIALYFEALMWQPGALDWAPLAWPDTHEITGGGERPRPSRAELIERFIPLIGPRPRECWRTEVERLLG